jgi:K+-transporting ATPase KdpF subunit
MGGIAAVLYLTAVLTVLALIYLGYVMIRPERF